MDGMNGLAVKQAETDARSRSNTKRLDILEPKVDNLQRLTTAVEVMAEQMKHQTEAMSSMKNDLTTLNGKVEALEQRPARNWGGILDKLIGAVISAGVAALIAALVAR